MDYFLQVLLFFHRIKKYMIVFWQQIIQNPVMNTIQNNNKEVGECETIFM